MTRPRPTAFEGELEHRLAILAHCENTERRLPQADSLALVAITMTSFAVVIIAQTL